MAKRGEQLKRSVRERRATEGRLRKALAYLRRVMRRQDRAGDVPPETRRQARAQRRRTIAAHKRTVVAVKRLANHREKVHAPPGELALRTAGRMLGKTETGQNDALWLRRMEDALPHDRLDWMIPGQPYCGFGCIWSWWIAVAELLPDGTVYTPNIAGYNGMVITARDGRKYRLVRVAPEQAAKGALVVMDFTGDGGADHVGLARDRMRSGVIPTRDFNTSPGNAGSQANGGGVWDRLRYRQNVIAVINIVPV